MGEPPLLTYSAIVIVTIKHYDLDSINALKLEYNIS